MTSSPDLPEISQHPKDSPAERAAHGKAARKRVPRSSHGEWAPASDRPDPIALLEEQAAERAQDLVPIRYGRMLASPFAFYRGAALIMASDLSRTPASGLTAQICGDAHLMNFGLFGSAERRLVFDINDFDETLPGPWEWDLKRLVAGFAIAGRERGFGSSSRRSIVEECVRYYREAMAEFAEMRAMDVWYARVDADTIRSAVEATRVASLKEVDKALAKATGKDSLRALSKLTEPVDGLSRFRSDPPLLVPAKDLLQGDERHRYATAVEEALRNYRESLPRERHVLFDMYRFREIARKVVGVGSVGTRAWVLLFFGRDHADPLFLQAKQAQSSVLERFVGHSRYSHSGRRVVEGQRLMQTTGDILLGWHRVTGFDGKEYHFYVRQLWDGKGAFDVARLPRSAWFGYARMCAWTLARAHARTGDRTAIAAYMGSGDSLDKAIADFAEAYAEQNQRDYEALQAAVDSGRIEATTGV
jgi:uncharacterized protein (DUF2252 family)